MSQGHLHHWTTRARQRNKFTGGAISAILAASRQEITPAPSEPEPKPQEPTVRCSIGLFEFMRTTIKE